MNPIIHTEQLTKRYGRRPAPGGWATFVVYPAFVLWLVAVIVTMLRPARSP